VDDAEGDDEQCLLLLQRTDKKKITEGGRQNIVVWRQPAQR